MSKNHRLKYLLCLVRKSVRPGTRSVSIISVYDMFGVHSVVQTIKLCIGQYACQFPGLQSTCIGSDDHLMHDSCEFNPIWLWALRSLIRSKSCSPPFLFRLAWNFGAIQLAAFDSHFWTLVSSRMPKSLIPAAFKSRGIKNLLPIRRNQLGPTRWGGHDLV